VCFSTVGPPRRFSSGFLAFQAYPIWAETFLAAPPAWLWSKEGLVLFYPPSSRSTSFQAVLAPFLQDEGLPFADVLTAHDVQEAFDDEGCSFGHGARAVFTPALVLWAFLSQVLSTDKSCRAAVLRILVLLVSLERGPCSTDTGAYCRARAKLPVAVLRRLALQVGHRLEEAVPSQWLWKNHHVFLVDGATVSLPDTPENQQAYPQPPTQKPGLGFPMIRMVVLLSLATAGLQSLAFGPSQGKETGEPALLRTLLEQIPHGSILLADRYYCSYFLIALLQAYGVAVVFRLHQSRPVDFRRGRRLGPDDHLVTWRKPARPKWLDPALYATLPATLTVREVRTRVCQRGYRVEELVVTTTLMNPDQYSKDELTDLYHERWHVELDIRSIKQSLGMETLRCLSPFMVEKELWAYWLGYNLVRKVAAQAALARGRHPREISFTATRQAVVEGWKPMTLGSPRQRLNLGRALLVALGKEEVGDRPGRCEPRAVKRRPKPYPRLMKPRQQARAELMGK
jgi:putative transposase